MNQVEKKRKKIPVFLLSFLLGFILFYIAFYYFYDCFTFDKGSAVTIKTIDRCWIKLFIHQFSLFL